MENISKALMIAGGILIAILVLALIAVLWSRMSGYFTEQHNTTIVNQIAEFNAQFENYNGKDIRGNELISVMNKVVNYNRTYSDMENYDKIIIEIDLDGHADEFAYTGTADLFPNDLIDNNVSDTEIQRISELSVTLTSSASGIPEITDTKLQKLSASISIVLDDSDSEYRKKKLKSILGYEVNDVNQLNKIKEATKKYYQYTQFKRAMFKCTGIEHDTTNGRVNGITFKVVTVTDASGTHIKFD